MSRVDWTILIDGFSNWEMGGILMLCPQLTDSSFLNQIADHTFCDSSNYRFILTAGSEATDLDCHLLTRKDIKR